MIMKRGGYHDFDYYFPNSERDAHIIKNDRIWTLNIEDIPAELKLIPQSKGSSCIGVSLLFTAKKLKWVIKERSVMGWEIFT